MAIIYNPTAFKNNKVRLVICLHLINHKTHLRKKNNKKLFEYKQNQYFCIMYILYITTFVQIINPGENMF